MPPTMIRTGTTSGADTGTKVRTWASVLPGSSVALKLRKNDASSAEDDGGRAPRLDVLLARHERADHPEGAGVQGVAEDEPGEQDGQRPRARDPADLHPPADRGDDQELTPPISQQLQESDEADADDLAGEELARRIALSSISTTREDFSSTTPMATQTPAPRSWP